MPTLMVKPAVATVTGFVLMVGLAVFTVGMWLGCDHSGSSAGSQEQALYQLALRYGNGTGVDYDAERAKALLEEAAEAGHMDAQFFLGLAYGNGSGVDRNPSLAEKWLKRAAANGHSEARQLVAHFEEAPR